MESCGGNFFSDEVSVAFEVSSNSFMMYFYVFLLFEPLEMAKNFSLRNTFDLFVAGKKLGKLHNLRMKMKILKIHARM
jgi:hypothetical protein